VLGITTGHESRGFFMPHLNESYFVLALAESFHDAVDSVARQSEYHVHAPRVKGLDEDIGSSFAHNV
jgi:hypothetical protein